MIQAVGLHLGVTAGVVIVAGIGLTSLISYEYTGDRSFQAMRLMEQPVAVKLVAEPTALDDEDRGRSRLQVIHERGSIRVGYFSNRLPYVFRNDQGDVVGMDMEIMHELARDLDISIELTRLKKNQSGAQMLLDGRLDIIVGGKAITPAGALNKAFSDSYTSHTAGLMVTDARRDDFSSVNKIKAMKDLNLGILDSIYYRKPIQEMFPNATFTTLESPRKFFKGQQPDIDAFFYSTEAGFAWAMLYPAYSSIVPKGLKLKAPVGFSLPKGQFDFTHYINTWLDLKRENAYLQRVYDYWILGENPKAKKPRWSVMRNVLGWGV